MKQLPIRGKKKSPKYKKVFLENKQNSFPARVERKEFLSRPFIPGKDCCVGTGEMRLQGMKAAPYGRCGTLAARVPAPSNAAFDTVQGAPYFPLAPYFLYCDRCDLKSWVQMQSYFRYTRVLTI